MIQNRQHYNVFSGIRSILQDKKTDSGSMGHFAGWIFMSGIALWKRRVIFAVQPEA